MSRHGRIVVGYLVALLAGLSAQGQPYERQTGDTGECLWWHSRELSLSANSEGNPQTTGESEFVATQAALSTWNDAAATCSDLSFLYAGPTSSARVGYFPFPGETNENLLVFRMRPCQGTAPASDPCWANFNCGNAYACWEHSSSTVAVPTVTYDLETAAILDADIELNGANFVFTTVDSPVCTPPSYHQGCVANDVQNIVTAMMGRAIGLGSVHTPGSTMNPVTPAGDLSKRTIDPGTLEGLCAIYPRGLPATTCDGGFVDSGSADGGGGDGGALVDGGFGGGGSALPCGPANCGGCCTPQGLCEGGAADLACGAGGAACALCPAGARCAAGQCEAVAAAGCGCAQGGGAFAVAAAFLLALLGARRRA